MIVDDNEDVRFFLRSLFEDKAEEIIECSNGLTAVELYNEHQPDVVLMDIEMKTMDGITATEKIIQRNQRLPERCTAEPSHGYLAVGVGRCRWRSMRRLG